MKKWLLTQVVVFFPSLTFCLIAVVLIWSLPEEQDNDNFLLDIVADGIELTQQRSDGSVLTMQTEQLVKQPSGEFNIEHVRLRVQRQEEELNFSGEQATLDAKQEVLTLPQVVGVLTTKNNRATFALQTMSYHLADGEFSGTAAKFEDSDKQVYGDRLTLTANGQVVVEGNVRARFF